MNRDLIAKIIADAQARGFRPISGTTDIECPTCKGTGWPNFKDTVNKKCLNCKGHGVIKHKWKIAVVLENGEPPENPYPCDTPEHTQRHFACDEGFALMSIKKYRQVVE